MTTLFGASAVASGVRIDLSIPPMEVSGADGTPTQLGISEGRLQIRMPGGNGLLIGSAALLVGNLPAFSIIDASGKTPGPSLSPLNAYLNQSSLSLHDVPFFNASKMSSVSDVLINARFISAPLSLPCCLSPLRYLQRSFWGLTS